MHTSTRGIRTLRWALCVTAVAVLAACANLPSTQQPLPSAQSAARPASSGPAEPVLPRPAVVARIDHASHPAPLAAADAIAAPAQSAAAAGLEPVPADTPKSSAESQALPERGLASWYGPRFHGRRSANGERYDQHALTAAHKTLPFNTLVLVRSVATGREVVVRITDRGRLPGRIIDLSRAAAKELGMLRLGLAEVILLDAIPEPGPGIVPETAAPLPAPTVRAPSGP